MSTMSSLELCAVCCKDGGKLCAVCKSCCYCSKECQRMDWSSHKKLCKIAEADSEAGSKRPSPFHLKAIYFPDNKDTYEFVWVEYFPNLDHPLGPRDIPKAQAIRAIFGRDSPIKIKPHFWGSIRKKEPHQSVTFFPNDLAPGKDRPLLIVGSVDENGPPGKHMSRFVDATLADFRAIYHSVSPTHFKAALPYDGTIRNG
ncbi:hypothetical protein F4781DRAFT_419156 [Annulohypoxylon bovei var. microspora]|nr:hypothetical protein F4781DRAFT_419156 [Annulohypoxylon bovei var. microspora]